MPALRHQSCARATRHTAGVGDASRSCQIFRLRSMPAGHPEPFRRRSTTAPPELKNKPGQACRDRLQKCSSPGAMPGLYRACTSVDRACTGCIHAPDMTSITDQKTGPACLAVSSGQCLYDLWIEFSAEGRRGDNFVVAGVQRGLSGPNDSGGWDGLLCLFDPGRVSRHAWNLVDRHHTLG